MLGKWIAYAILGAWLLTTIALVMTNNYEVKTTYKPIHFQHRMAMNELVTKVNPGYVKPTK